MCVISAAVAGGTMAAIAANTAIVASVAAAGMGVYSSIQQTRAQNEQMKYQSKVAENNALAAQYEADYAKAKAGEEARQQRVRTQQFIGAQRAAMAATGVAVESETFLDLTLDTAEQGKLDELAILHQGDLDAWRLEAQAEGYTGQASAYGASMGSPVQAGVTAGVGGLAQAGLSYYQMSQPRVK